MAVEITGPQRRPSWPEQRMQLWWLRSLAALALALCLFGAGIGILNFARVTAGLEAQAMAVMLLGVVAGVAAMTVHWAHTALVGRVDILSQALDASPDAQLIIAPNGSVVYANAAFNLLFPGTDEAPLDRIARAVAADVQAQTDFRRRARRRRRLVQHLGQSDRRPLRLQLLEPSGHHCAPRNGGGHQ
jgi:PAS domain-containing protein